MKDTLKKLLAAYGATGREENVAQVIAEMIKPYVDEMRIDALGNLVAVRHGAGVERIQWLQGPVSAEAGYWRDSAD